MRIVSRGELSPISLERADELKSELEGYEADMHLLDGITASDSLAMVVRAPKTFGRPTIVFNGADYANRLANQSAQRELFDTSV
jgi:hypothetical protein